MTMRLRSTELTWQALDDEVVVLDLRTSNYFVINGSGAVLWERLAEQASAEELADELRAAYEVPSEVARADVAAFVEDLRGRGLLETA